MRPPTWISFISIPPTCPRQVKRAGRPPARGGAGRALGSGQSGARASVAPRWRARPAPIASLEAGIAAWPETATCVGVSLGRDDALRILCPHGLSDLYALILRPSPALADPALFAQTAARQALYREMAQVAPRGRARTEFMSALKYLTGYPPPARPGPQAHGPGPPLRARYPQGPHGVRTDRQLYDYVVDLKNAYIRNGDPISKVAYDSKIQVSSMRWASIPMYRACRAASSRPSTRSAWRRCSATCPRSSCA